MRVYLLVDETKIKDRIAVMMVGIAFDSRCIPLVWYCYKANSKKGYPRGGQSQLIAYLLSLVQRGMPSGMKAVVMADRGIGTSPKLCKQVNKQGLYYLFRITKQTQDHRQWTGTDHLQSSEAGQQLVSQRHGFQATGPRTGTCPRYLGQLLWYPIAIGDQRLRFERVGVSEAQLARTDLSRPEERRLALAPQLPGTPR